MARRLFLVCKNCNEKQGEIPAFFNAEFRVKNAELWLKHLVFL